MDEYWKGELRELFLCMKASVDKLEKKLPPEGFEELESLRFDIDLADSIVKRELS